MSFINKCGQTSVLAYFSQVARFHIYSIDRESGDSSTSGRKRIAR